MSTYKQLILFTEGGKGIGYGHISRCSALYDEALNMGLCVTMVVNKAAENIKSLKYKNVKYVDWQYNNKIDDFNLKDCYCVVDSYLADVEVYNNIFEKCKKVVFFDDEKRIDYPNGIILNMSVNSGYEKWQSLLGLEYAVVRKAFVQAKKKGVRNTIKSILIFLGADFQNLSDELIKSLQMQFKDIQIHLIKTAISKSTLKATEMLTIHEELDEFQFADLISKCDVGIITASQTAIEFCCIGTPFICIKTASNQSFEWMEKNSIIEEGLENSDSQLLNKIFEQIIKLNSKAERNKLMNLMQSLIKGTGANNVLRKLVSE